jgi:hypothetical protein
VHSGALGWSARGRDGRIGPGDWITCWLGYPRDDSGGSFLAFGDGKLSFHMYTYRVGARGFVMHFAPNLLWEKHYLPSGDCHKLHESCGKGEEQKTHSFPHFAKSSRRPMQCHLNLRHGSLPSLRIEHCILQRCPASLPSRARQIPPDLAVCPVLDAARWRCLH